MSCMRMYIRRKYKIATLGQITKYLGVQYKWDRDENSELYVTASGKIQY